MKHLYENTRDLTEPVSADSGREYISNNNEDVTAFSTMPIYDKIPWCSFTWNPIMGCSICSAGCLHCYTTSWFQRFNKVLGNFNEVRCFENRLDIPRKKKTPSMIFTVSMGDLFHKDVPTEFIKKVFKVMNECPQHIFQVLTKRDKRLLELSPELNWTPNIWMGVSVENSDYTYRIDSLRQTGAQLKILSLEPLIGPLPNMNLEGISLIIVGGESGRNFRPMPHEWARDIRNQCREMNIPFFFKQSAGFKKEDKARLLDGIVHHELPNNINHNLTFSNLNKETITMENTIDVTKTVVKKQRKPKYKSRAIRAEEQATEIQMAVDDIRDLVNEEDLESLNDDERENLIESINEIITGIDFGELESLADEMASWRDNMQGTNLESTMKYAEVEEAANTLENIDPSIDEISDIDEIDERLDELEEKVSEIQSVIFPTMFG